MERPEIKMVYEFGGFEWCVFVHNKLWMICEKETSAYLMGFYKTKTALVAKFMESQEDMTAKYGDKLHEHIKEAVDARRDVMKRDVCAVCWVDKET